MNQTLAILDFTCCNDCKNNDDDITNPWNEDFFRGNKDQMKFMCIKNYPYSTCLEINDDKIICSKHKKAMTKEEFLERQAQLIIFKEIE